MMDLNINFTPHEAATFLMQERPDVIFGILHALGMGKSPEQVAQYYQAAYEKDNPDTKWPWMEKLVRDAAIFLKAGSQAVALVHAIKIVEHLGSSEEA